MRARLRRAGELADQLEVAEPGGDAEVDRLEAQQLCDLAVAPEQRRDQRRASVAASEEVGARTGIEQQPRELAVVAVARLVELRPAVVVSAIRIRAPLEEQ
jgi:hypothetical protein